ncbi:hypothetical protein [Kibdelosporangium philippinense]
MPGVADTDGTPDARPGMPSDLSPTEQSLIDAARGGEVRKVT